MSYFAFFLWYGDHRELHVLAHSFPTRRSAGLNSAFDLAWPRRQPFAPLAPAPRQPRSPDVATAALGSLQALQELGPFPATGAAQQHLSTAPSQPGLVPPAHAPPLASPWQARLPPGPGAQARAWKVPLERSEERRVGKEGVSTGEN